MAELNSFNNLGRKKGYIENPVMNLLSHLFESKVELSKADIEVMQKRIIEKYEPSKIVSEVFTAKESQDAFIEGLCELNTLERKVDLGGRTLRNHARCLVDDFSKRIVENARDLKGNAAAVTVLGPLIDILINYDENRLSKPDLDFFIWDSNPEELKEIFENKGFKVTIQRRASRGICVVEIHGENGMATFVDGEESSQTKDGWPMFAFKAAFKNEEEPFFELNISSARLYVYPLAVMGIDDLDPLDPRRFAIVGRALLWAVTASVVREDGYTQRLRPPYQNMFHIFANTVFHFPELLKRIEENPDEEFKYRSGIRDLALALRVILLMRNSYGDGFNDQMQNFFKVVGYSWYYGKVLFYDTKEG